MLFVTIERFINAKQKILAMEIRFMFPKDGSPYHLYQTKMLHGELSKCCHDSLKDNKSERQKIPNLKKNRSSPPFSCSMITIETDQEASR